MKILAIDPSMTNVGWVVMENDKIIACDVIRSKPGSGRKRNASSRGGMRNTRGNAYVVVDDADRVGKIYADLISLVTDHHIDVIVTELPTGSKNGRTAMAFGMVVGYMACVSMACSTSGVHTHILIPSEVKAATGIPKADKAAIIAWAKNKHPEVEWIKLRGKFLLRNEHIADAIAVAHGYLKKIA